MAEQPSKTLGAALSAAPMVMIKVPTTASTWVSSFADPAASVGQLEPR